MSTDKTMARIGALLLRAEGTDNRHEADACITRAQTLATLNSIDIAVARAHAVQRRSSVASSRVVYESDLISGTGVS